MRTMNTLLVILVLALSALAYSSFTCPYHPQGQCHTDGQVRHDDSGRVWEHYSCTCGDSGWVRE
jgi:hypothetical protein